MLRAALSLMRLPASAFLAGQKQGLARAASTHVSFHYHRSPCILPSLAPPTVIPALPPVTQPLVPNLKIRLPTLSIVPATPTPQPSPNPVVEKHAARLVVIRRKKMKKHKLRKLRKKMKFVLIKINQRRELKKEKAFQGELVAQIKQAEAFDPKEYVASFIKKVKDTKAEIEYIRNIKPPKREDP